MILHALRVLVIAVFALAGWGSFATAAFTKTVTVTSGTFQAAVNFTPILRSVPDVEGSPIEGASLTAGDATWDSGLTATTGTTYEWLRCDGSGASCTSAVAATTTKTNYTVLPGDAGSTFRLRVVGARGAAPTVTTTSPPSPVAVAASGINATVATNTVKPSISGTTTVGQDLTAVNGTWAPAPNSFAWQWLRCDAYGDNCSDILLATGATYRLTNADRGLRLRVRVTATVNNALNPKSSQATTFDTSLVD